MSSFFKQTVAVAPEAISPAAASALAKFFSSPSGAVISDADAAWGEIIKIVRMSASDYGFSPVDLAPVEEGLAYDKNLLSSFPQGLGFSWQNKEFFVRLSPLYAMLRLYQTLVSSRGQFVNKWYSIFPSVKTGAKGQLMVEWQVVLTALGDISVVAEAQMTCVLWETCSLLGLEDKLQLDVNSIGGGEVQKTYTGILQEYLHAKRYHLCDACGEFLSSNPLEILRCQQLDCQTLLAEGPVILDSLDDVSQKQLTQYLEAMEELGIPYQLNPLYAGPKTANGTCFSLKIRAEDKLLSFAEGFGVNNLPHNTSKSYNGLVALGSLAVLRQALCDFSAKSQFEVYLVPLGELAVKKSLRLMKNLNRAGVSVYDGFGSNGVKSQLKFATDSKGKLALIMGQREATEAKVILRDLMGGIQETFHFDQVVEEVKKRLGR